MALLWMLLRVRWRRSLTQCLVVALVIGTVGGFAFAAAASARRVDSSYRALLAEIDAPDLLVFAECVNVVDENVCLDASDPQGGEERLLASGIVEQARLIHDLVPYLIDADGAPLLAQPDNPTGCFERDRSVHLVPLGDGGPREQAVPFRLDGDLPRQGGRGVVLALATAERTGLGIGDDLRLAGWCTEDGDPVELATVIDLRVTGISVGPLDVEPPATGLSIEPAYIDPEVFEELVSAGAEPEATMSVWLDANASSLGIADGLAEFEVIVDLRERANVLDEALAADARLLRLLAGIGALSGVLVLAPLIGRNLRDTGPDTTTLAALGVQRPQIVRHAIAHCCSLAFIGALTAAVVAVPMGALMPDGLAAAIEPDPDLSFDWLVTVAGLGLLVIGVVGVGILPAWRIGSTARAFTSATSSGVGVVRGMPLRPAARTGILAAIGTPVGPRRASPWPSLASMVMVATVGVASVTYLSGLRHLERTPSVLGSNWDAWVNFNEVPDPLEVPAIVARIAEVDGVEQVTAAMVYPPWFLVSPGTDIPIIFPWTFDTGPDAITPTMLGGRAPEGPDEVAIDIVFAEQAGLTIGDTVLLQREPLQSVIVGELQVQAAERGLDPPVLRIVDAQPVAASFEITGIAVLPFERQEVVAQVVFTLDGYAAFVDPTDEEIVAARAWLPDDLLPELLDVAEEVLSTIRIAGRPDRVYLRFSGDKQAALAELLEVEGIPEVTAPTADQVITFIGLNLDRNDRVPVALAVTMSVAFAMLAGYLLFAAVRARRFEMAVMRAMGMSTGGIRRSVAAQATATVVVALVVAIPAGIAIGRWAWLSYARGLDVLPVSITPWPALAVAAAAAIVAANVAALTLGWSATTRSPGPDLRSE